MQPAQPLSMIVAASDNDVIGYEGKMPWRIPADLRRFKRLTMGHHLIMGRKTFESIGRVLPGRQTIMLTRNPEFQAKGVTAVRSIEEALALVAEDPEPFVVGGAEIFRAMLPSVGKIYLTRVHCFVDGDTFIDCIRWDDWDIDQREPHFADDENEYDFTFFDYVPKSELPPIPFD